MVSMKDQSLAQKRRRMSKWLRRLGGADEQSSEPPEEEGALDCLIREHLSDELGRRQALQALRILGQEFVDWNEVRVTRDGELAKMMGELGVTVERAGRLRGVLGALFERTNGLSLDHLRGKPHHEIDALMGALGVSRRAASATALRALGANVLTVEVGALRVLRRLEAVEAPSADEALEELSLVVAASDRADFYRLFAGHGRRVCTERAPSCPECVLLSDCPTGRARKASKTKRGRPAATGKRSGKASKTQSTKAGTTEQRG